MKYWYLLFLIFLLGSNFYYVESGSCTSYTSQQSCSSNSLCYWGGTSCNCASTVTQDVAFVIDASGSIGQSNWNLQIAAIQSMISTGLANTSRVGIVVFASSSQINYKFTDDQNRTVVNNTVKNLVYSGGSTYMKSGVQSAITLFDTYSSSAISKLMVLITDGAPSSGQSPCSLAGNLTSRGIYSVILGIGSGFSSTAVKCLVANTATDIIKVSSFSSFSAIRNYSDSYLCPASIALQLTEVRVGANSSGAGNNSQWIEFYISGDSIPLTTNPLRLAGMLSGNITSFINTTIGKSTLTGKTYVVLYNSDAGYSKPVCYNCTCGDSNNDKFCDNATYIPCNSSSTFCKFLSTYNGNPVSRTNWGVTILDGSDSSNLISVNYTSSFPSLTQNYAYYLTSLTATASTGSNWAQSCYSYGTPGDTYISSCTACTLSGCTSNGDTSATCPSEAASCSCTESKYYFQDGSTCRYLPQPISCYSEIDVDDSGTHSDGYNIHWDLNDTLFSTYFYGYYVSGTDSQTFTTAVNQLSWYFTNPDFNQLPYVRTAVNIGNTVKYSNTTYCPYKTLSPTKQPTLAPTYSIPTISLCSATVRAGSNTIINASWSNAVTSSTSPSTVTTYRLYLYINGALSSTKDCSSTTCLFTSTTSITSSNFNNFELKVAAYVDGSQYTTSMENSATNCPISTSAPTNAPTHSPSPAPTRVPTFSPVALPTSPPTFSEWSVNSCIVSLSQDKLSANISYDLNTPGAGASLRNPTYFAYVNNIQYSVSSATTSSGRVTNLDSLSGTETWKLQVKWTELIGSTTASELTICSVITYAPTYAPTKLPTRIPTTIPTKTPTYTPTKRPTQIPTSAPTYQTIAISNCVAQLGKYQNGLIKTFQISFDTPTYNPPSTPEKSQIKYEVKWGTSNVVYYDGSSSSGDSFTASVASSNSLSDFNQLSVTIVNSDNVNTKYGSSVSCLYNTSSPTLSPTPGPSPSPTPAPTYGPRYIYIDKSYISCQSEEVIPTCSIKESSTTTKSIKVLRTPLSYPYTTTFSWNIECYSPCNISNGTAGPSAEDFNYTLDGVVTINAYEDSALIELTIVNEQGDDNTYWDLSGDESEQFLLSLSCNSIEECLTSSTKDTPTSMIMAIGDGPGQANVSTTKKTDIPQWIWYPVAGGILIGLLLGYFIYRWNQKRKLADRDREGIEKNAKKEQELDNVGEFGGVGDTISFNPMATGIQGVTLSTTDEFIENELQKQMTEMEVATVEVDDFKIKQEFGQVQTDQSGEV